MAQYRRNRQNGLPVMPELTQEDKEQLFPAECHFKVIAVDLVGLGEKLNTILSDCGVSSDVFRPGNRSVRGKYVTYNASIYVDTHARMKQIDSALRQVDGVKMVL